MFQLGMVVQQRIPMTNIYDTPEAIFGSPKKTSKSSNFQKPFKEVLGMMLQGPVLQGTTSFEYTFPGSLHCSFKINDTKENSTKNIQKQQSTFQTFSTQTHTHRHITRQQICRGIVGASIFAIDSVLRSFRSGLWECFQGTKSARELISTCTNELKMVMSSNFCSDRKDATPYGVKNQISRREKGNQILAFGSNKNTHQSPYFLEILRI